MSGQAFKAGDVAHIKGSGLDTIAIRTAQGSWVWVDRHGSNPIANSVSLCAENWGGTATRIVVIDPEDREQVERLLATLLDSFGKDLSREIHVGDIGQAQAALREFANPTPPKPEEPQGLGAVVEDADGALWVRVGVTIGDLHWRSTEPGNTNCFKWQAIEAVRVLSEGVVV